MAPWLGLLAVLTPGQEAEYPPLPEIAVVVVTLDGARQDQAKHGRKVIAMSMEYIAAYRRIEPTLPLDDLQNCEDEQPERGLGFCVRHTLDRAWAEGSPPHVVVVLTDRDPRAPRTRHPDEMRALCYGRGATAANAEAQDIWLWPGSDSAHGAVESEGAIDIERDMEVVHACIEAALSEVPGEARPSQAEP